MKLKDKKTGEIGRLKESDCDEYEYLVVIEENPQACRYYHTLKEVADNYEDYEEPEIFWYINECGDVLEYEYTGGCPAPMYEAEEIGNRFRTREDAEKAKEKLKALARLRKNNFTFDDYVRDKNGIKSEGEIYFSANDYDGIREDLRIVFGGEE